MIKDIVVNLGLGERDPAGDFAISVAETFEAHLLGVAFIYDPIIPGSVMGGIPPEFIESQRAEARKGGERRHRPLRAGGQARRHLVRNAQRSTPASPAPPNSSAAWRGVSTSSIVGQAERDRSAPEEVVDEGVLFESGRPVIVVPYIQKAGLKLDRVMVCWDGSRAATRAIADACRSCKRPSRSRSSSSPARPARTTKFPAPISASISPATA